MSHSVLSSNQFDGGRDNSGGTWHPGMGSAPADKGFKGPSGGSEAPTWQTTFAGELVSRKSTQAGDPTIDDKANRRNVKLGAERNGPAGVVSCSRAYSGASQTDTGRNVRTMPSAHGNGDFRRAAKGGD